MFKKIKNFLRKNFGMNMQKSFPGEETEGGG